MAGGPSGWPRPKGDRSRVDGGAGGPGAGPPLRPPRMSARDPVPAARPGPPARPAGCRPECRQGTPCRRPGPPALLATGLNVGRGPRAAGPARPTGWPPGLNVGPDPVPPAPTDARPASSGHSSRQRMGRSPLLGPIRVSAGPPGQASHPGRGVAPLASSAPRSTCCPVKGERRRRPWAGVPDLSRRRRVRPAWRSRRRGRRPAARSVSTAGQWRPPA